MENNSGKVVRHNPKDFGKHAKYLSSKTKVPWDIAVMLSNKINNETACNLLNYIKGLRENELIRTLYNERLSSDSNAIRSQALEDILGGQATVFINFKKSAKRSQILADYLLGK